MVSGPHRVTQRATVPAYGVAYGAGWDGLSFRSAGMGYRSCAAPDFKTTGGMALEPHFQHHQHPYESPVIARVFLQAAGQELVEQSVVEDPAAAQARSSVSGRT